MIQPNASPSEKQSPFYEVNESFCQTFEKYIRNKNGISSGSYNAWSYSIIGKINHPTEWILEYKKSTFSSGNLLLSSKRQNLLTSVIWKTKGETTSEFFIRKRKLKDYIFKNKKLSHITNDYTIISNGNFNEKKIHLLLKILKPIIDTKEIYHIKNLNKELVIELRTDRHYFDIFNQLIDFKF